LDEIIIDQDCPRKETWAPRCNNQACPLWWEPRL